MSTSEKGMQSKAVSINSINPAYKCIIYLLIYWIPLSVCQLWNFHWDSLADVDAWHTKIEKKKLHIFLMEQLFVVLI